MSEAIFSNTRVVRIEWGDCDPAGIVFNPRYFAFFDAATAGLFEAAGMPKWELFKLYPGFGGVALVESAASFRSPCRFGDDLTIVSSITGLGRSSLKVRHVASRGDTVAVEATETRVWIMRDPEKPNALRSGPIPDDVRRRFGAG